MSPETYILAPSVIADRARQLAGAGLYKQALELLQRNCVEATVTPTRVEMKLARELNHHQQREQFLGTRRGVKTRRSKRLSQTTTENLA